eukprot:GHRQ01016348.1.p1 GENE.GHRQ01016348.1~~GHRQ01016348.1.p1  ORF type:complete len:121 (+),score=21.33 GHRQ01016348.1:221-583(+)
MPHALTSATANTAAALPTGCTLTELCTALLLMFRSRVNVCSPDLVKHPLFAGVGALEAVLGPGDAVFFPSMWAHYTESLGESAPARCAAGIGAEGSAGGGDGNSSVCGCSMSVTFRVSQV